VARHCNIFSSSTEVERRRGRAAIGDRVRELGGERKKKKEKRRG
jgi:hypothetical protein